MRSVSLFILAVSCAACAGTSFDDSDIVVSAHAAILQAKLDYQQLEVLGFAWRDTEEMIRQSGIYFEKGNYPAALELAKRSQQQVDKARQQYEEQHERVSHCTLVELLSDRGC